MKKNTGLLLMIVGGLLALNTVEILFRFFDPQFWSDLESGWPTVLFILGFCALGFGMLYFGWRLVKSVPEVETREPIVAISQPEIKDEQSLETPSMSPMQFVRSGLFKTGMKLMIVGGVISFIPILPALLSAVQTGDVTSSSAAIWFVVLTLPIGGVIAILGLVKLASQTGARVFRRLLFTSGLFFGLFFLGCGFGLLAVEQKNASVSGSSGLFALAAFNLIVVVITFISLFRAENPKRKG
jgi:hypothetical protein